MTALLASPSLADEGEVERGKALADRLCATCHMGPGQGEKLGPSGIPSFTAVARRPNQTMAGILGWLRSTPAVMPNHHLTQDEMSLLASYIMSLRED